MKQGQETNQIWTQEAGTHDTHDRGLTGTVLLGYYCFFFYLKIICAYRRVHNKRTLCLLHTQGRTAAHKHAKY